MSAKNPAFNPFKYHLGSVWPVENATAALGMKRYGCLGDNGLVAGFVGARFLHRAAAPACHKSLDLAPIACFDSSFSAASSGQRCPSGWPSSTCVRRG